MRFLSLFPLVFSLAAAASPTATPPAKKVLPFLEDDYQRALSEARARAKPLFIEAWAPW